MQKATKPVPHDVQKLLDESSALLNTLEQKKYRAQSPTRISSSATAQVIKNATQPPEMPGEAGQRTTAMEFLLRNKGYLLDEDVKIKAYSVIQQSSRIIDQSLSDFFLGDVPDLRNTKYQENAREHVAEVLAAAGPEKPEKPVFKSVKTNYRTLYKSIAVFRQFMQQEVPIGASIFTHALRGFNASWFLLSDLKEALKIDSKEYAYAAELVLDCLRASFSDYKAGEMLMLGEIARLKEEMRQTNILLQKNKEEAKFLIMQLENRRKAEVGQLKQRLIQVEQQRKSEVEELLYKTQEFADQVKTLRGIVDVIRSDQSVQEVERLKKHLAEQEALVSGQKQTISYLQEQLQHIQKQFSDFKIEMSSAQEQVETLKFELKRSEMQREICKNCGQKIHAQSKAIADDVQQRLQRNQEVLSRQGTIQQQLDQKKEILSLLEQLKKQVEVDEQDRVIFKLDMFTVVYELIFAENQLKTYPQVEELQSVIALQKTEIERLKAMEVDYLEIKQLYKYAISRQTNDSAPGNEQQANSVVTNQKIAENYITLLRTQPLYFLLPKQFDIKLVKPTQADYLQNPLAITSCLAQCAIYKFVSHLIESSLGGSTKFTDYYTTKLAPPKSNCPQQMDEPVSAIFNGYVHQSFALSSSQSKVQDAELFVNKIAYLLSKYADSSSDVQIDDETGYIHLAHVLFNQPLTADELQYLVFVFALAVGGQDGRDEILRKPLYRLRLTDQIKTKYISLRRVFLIVQIVLNKAVQKEFLTKLVESGRQTDALHDVAAIDLPKYDVVDADVSLAKDLLLDGSTLENAQTALNYSISVLQLPFFVSSVLRAYRTEYLVRIEALRVLYAADLLEAGERILTDSARYRIVRQTLQAISPLAAQPVVDAVYLDTIWRSPSALWAVLIDACRVRGLFSSALRLPPLDCVMQLCGGYCKQARKYDYTALFHRFTVFTTAFGALAVHLLALDSHELRALGVQIQTLLQTDLNIHNILIIIAMAKSVLLQVLDQLCGIIAARALDPSDVDLSQQNSADLTVNRQKRLPAEIYLDAFQGVFQAIIGVLGWAERDRIQQKQPKKGDAKAGRK